MKMFLNLPIKDLNKTVEFFTKLGFKFNPQFTDEKATCMLVGDGAFIMLVTEPYFKTFTKKDIADASSVTEAIVAVDVESREKVDEMVNLAIAAGAKPSNDKSDLGFMYSWSFQDLDGHLWEVFWMDPDHVE